MLFEINVVAVMMEQSGGHCGAAAVSLARFGKRADISISTRPVTVVAVLKCSASGKPQLL
ncbi:hypothetical protein EHI47_12280 [Rhizobium leguminosarum]|uniref:Uncharacterized protein n=1 Tax=Rhizobium leguminosarum TaxID=384 RepID=A0A444I2Y1_RHILE|nr:hypothetical protein [Rhizobium leguminosarum]RWX31817.1 hypothetical protein EHI47_12280 [Rhizobium leguminosarum]